MPNTMGKRRDKESGQYTKAIPDEEIVKFVKNRGGAGTAEVADRFDYRQPTVYRRLKALEEEGRVHSRKVGHSLLWEIDK